MFKLAFALLAIIAIHSLSLRSVLAADRALTIEDAVQSALDHSPLVSEIESRNSFRMAEALDTRLLPNPQLDAQIGIPSAWDERRGRNELDVSIEQPFRLSHGTLRNRLSRLIESTGSYEREKQLLELITKARLAYAQAWVLSERRRVLSEIAPRSKSLNDFVTKGVAEGAYGKGDEAVFRSAVAQIESELKGVSAESLLALAQLSRVTGEEMREPSLTSPEIAPFVSSDDLRTRLSGGSTQFQKRTRLLTELAEADMAVAKRDAFPEFRPRLSFSRTNEGTDIVGFGLTFDLPFYSQNSAERLKKDGELRAAQAQLQFSRSDAFQTVIVNEAEAYSLRRQQVELYKDKVLPALDDALKALEVQVRAGQGSIFSLWQVSREYIDAQGRYLELWTRAFSERVELAIILEEEM